MCSMHKKPLHIYTMWRPSACKTAHKSSFREMRVNCQRMTLPFPVMADPLDQFDIQMLHHRLSLNIYANPVMLTPSRVWLLRNITVPMSHYRICYRYAITDRPSPEIFRSCSQICDCSLMGFPRKSEVMICFDLTCFCSALSGILPHLKWFLSLAVFHYELSIFHFDLFVWSKQRLCKLVMLLKSVTHEERNHWFYVWLVVSSQSAHYNTFT